MATFLDMLERVKKYSTANHNTPIEDTVGIITMHEQDRRSEQLTPAEKLEANSTFKPLIAELYAADPDAELDPAEVAGRVGMRNCQGARSYVRHQLKQLRLTYQDTEQKAAAD
jgi:hypothetical protein